MAAERGRLAVACMRRKQGRSEQRARFSGRQLVDFAAVDRGGNDGKQNRSEPASHRGRRAERIGELTRIENQRFVASRDATPPLGVALVARQASVVGAESMRREETVEETSSSGANVDERRHARTV